MGGDRARATGGGNEGARGSSVMARPAPRPSRAGSDGGVAENWSMAKSREGGVVVMAKVVGQALALRSCKKGLSAAVERRGGPDGERTRGTRGGGGREPGDAAQDETLFRPSHSRTFACLTVALSHRRRAATKF